jgi:hypothetical protein
MKKIAFISQPEYFRFIYENCLDELFETREFPYHYDMAEDDFHDLLLFNAGYNIFFRGEFFPKSVLTRLKGKKIALSSEPYPRRIGKKWEWSLDSLRRYFAFRRMRERAFDFVFHYDPCSQALFDRDGLFLSGSLAFPVALDIYRPCDTEKKWDLFFIGRSTSHREELFLQLKHRFQFLHIAHGIWGPELVEYINRSRICLNVHAENEISWEPRVQMLLACGAFVVSEKITPNAYLRPGIDYVEFDDKQDLYFKVESFLKDDMSRSRIAENARTRMEELFDSKKVFPALIQAIEAGEYREFSAAARGSRLLGGVETLARFFKK